MQRAEPMLEGRELHHCGMRRRAVHGNQRLAIPSAHSLDLANRRALASGWPSASAER